MNAESRTWLAGLARPPAAREQIAVALAMIDAHDVQLAPLDEELRVSHRSGAAEAEARRSGGAVPLGFERLCPRRRRSAGADVNTPATRPAGGASSPLPAKGARCIGTRRRLSLRTARSCSARRWHGA